MSVENEGNLIEKTPEEIEDERICEYCNYIATKEVSDWQFYQDLAEDRWLKD